MKKTFKQEQSGVQKNASDLKPSSILKCLPKWARLCGTMASDNSWI
jgi:hypothetical protein